MASSYLDEEEQAFWSQFQNPEGAAADEVPAEVPQTVEPEVADPAPADADADVALPEASLEDDDDCLKIDVPKGLGTQEIQRKKEVIEKMSEGAILQLRGNRLYIRGPEDARKRAERLSTAVMERRVDFSGSGRGAEEGAGDLSLVPATRDFIKEWRGGEVEKSLEDFEVMVVLLDGEEDLSKGAMFALRAAQKLAGQVVEAQYDDKGGWFVGNVLEHVREARGKLRILWAYDGTVTDVEHAHVRRTMRVAIFGSIENRLKAELRLLQDMDETARGIAVAHAATRPKSRGLGIDAPLEARIKERLRNQLIDSERGGMMTPLLQVSGCTAITLTEQTPERPTIDRKERPEGEKPKFQNRSYRCVLAGTQDQRWRACNLLQFLAMIHDKRWGEPMPTVPPPPPLAGEYVQVNMPMDMMGGIFGKWGSNLRKMEADSHCMLVPYREKKSGAKKEATEDDDLLEIMFQSIRTGATREMVIFGEPRNRHGLMMKLMCMIETKYQGYYPKPEGDDPVESDPCPGLGVDKVWLPSDFEADATGSRGKFLGAACGCKVEAAGPVVFISGTKKERTRCREYLRWVVEWMNVKLKAKVKRLPHVEHPNLRKDAILMEPIAMTSWADQWLKNQMIKFSEKRCVWAFFDDFIPESDIGSVEGTDAMNRRMVIVGACIEKHGNTSDFADKLRGEANQMMLDLEEWRRDGGDVWKRRMRLEKQEKQQKEVEEQRRREDQRRQEEMAAEAAAASAASEIAERMPMPATPALPGSIPMPATPARAGHIPLPATPGAPVGRVPMPQTPAGPGAGSVPMPATPAGPSFGGGGILPPATPGGPGHSVPPPATPGGFASAVPPPGTPAVGMRPPQTPGTNLKLPQTPGAPVAGSGGQFGPHSSAVPATPAMLTMFSKPPATPGGFGPFGLSAPSTPGFGPHGLNAPATPAVGRLNGVPPPATPAPGGGRLNGLPPPATPAPGGARVSNVAPPATPGGFGPNSLDAPMTPGGPVAATNKDQADSYRDTDHVDDWMPPTKKRALGGARPAPETPALLGMAAPTPGAAMFGMAASPTPGAVPTGARPAPQTPAFLGGLGESRPPSTGAKVAVGGGKLLTFATVKTVGDVNPLCVGRPAAQGGALTFRSVVTASASPEPLPPGWEKRVSKSNGKAYYWNQKLAKSQYNRPTA